MKIQQHRLFFLTTATSNGGRGIPSWQMCFRPWGRIVVMLSAALLFGCTSLTPERVNVLADIAGQAVAQGASEWLAKHPEQREAFREAVAKLGAVLATDNKGPQSLEDAAVEFMNSLPASTLRGKDGEVYVTGDGKKKRAELVVWDDGLKKGVTVRDAAAEPVVRRIHLGLRRALMPKPPMPSTAKLALPPGVVARELEGGSGAMSGSALFRFNTNTPALTLTNLVTPPCVFDVTLNEHGIQQVNVRWVMAPNALYTVQRMEDKTWEGYSYAQNTNTVATPWVWTTLWPAVAEVGYWRVLRAR